MSIKASVMRISTMSRAQNTLRNSKVAPINTIPRGDKEAYGQRGPFRISVRP